MFDRKKTVKRTTPADALANAAAAVVLVPILIAETIFGLFSS